MKHKFLNITHKSLEEFGVKTYSELWEKNKGEYQGLSCEVPVTFERKTVKKADDTEEVVYTMVLSTADEDRHGDMVLQDFDLKWYKKNPVLLDSHNYDSITHIIGKVNNIRIEDGKLKGEVEFMMDNPKGALAKKMVEGGFLNASSIGFIPKEFDDKGRILKSELLENSMVSVPANARALFEKIAEDVDAEIKTVEADLNKETDEKKIIETKTVLDRKKVLFNSIAQSLKDMSVKNFNHKRREALKALRSFK